MIASHAVADMAMAFWNGSVGTSSAFFSGTLVRMIPLALIGTGLAIAFRAGVFNIGGEGQFLVGAVAATMVGLVSGNAPAPLAIAGVLIASVIAGASWAAIAAVLRARFGVLEVISTIMLNFVAANLVSFLVRGPLQEPTHIYPQTSAIPDAAHLPVIVSGTRLHIGILLAVVAGIAGWLFMTRTAAGFRFRIVGASPTAARVSGRVDLARTSSSALLLSGALAGLAGGIEVAGVTYALYDNLSPGYGFSAIAVAILAGLNPLGVLFSAFGFAILESGALGMQRDAGVPAVTANVIEALLILAIVAWGARLTGGLRFRPPPSQIVPR